MTELFSASRSFPSSPWPPFHLVFWFMLVEWSVLALSNYWTASITPVSSTYRYFEAQRLIVACLLSCERIWLCSSTDHVSCEHLMLLKQADSQCCPWSSCVAQFSFVWFLFRSIRLIREQWCWKKKMYKPWSRWKLLLHWCKNNLLDIPVNGILSHIMDWGNFHLMFWLALYVFLWSGDVRTCLFYLLYCVVGVVYSPLVVHVCSLLPGGVGCSWQYGEVVPSSVFFLIFSVKIGPVQ